MRGVIAGWDVRNHYCISLARVQPHLGRARKELSDHGTQVRNPESRPWESPNPDENAWEGERMHRKEKEEGQRKGRREEWEGMEEKGRERK